MSEAIYKILLMGPQGSGKGTQAERLSRRLGIPALSMGQLLRDEISIGSKMGKKVEVIIKAGNLVSDIDAAELLKERLNREDAQKGYILDGYPRNMSQFAAFNFDQPTQVIVIDISRDEAIKRLSGRLTCQSCGKVFNVAESHRPGDACPCGGVMSIREDDTAEAISKRLDIYEAETVPVIEQYSGQGIVKRINGIDSVDHVQEEILKNLGLR